MGDFHAENVGFLVNYGIPMGDGVSGAPMGSYRFFIGKGWGDIFGGLMGSYGVLHGPVGLLQCSMWSYGGEWILSDPMGSHSDTRGPIGKDGDAQLPIGTPWRPHRDPTLNQNKPIATPQSPLGTPTEPIEAP